MFLFFPILTTPCYSFIICLPFTSLPSHPTLMSTRQDFRQTEKIVLSQHWPRDSELWKGRKWSLFLWQGHLIYPIPWCSLYSFHRGFELKVLALKWKKKKKDNVFPSEKHLIFFPFQTPMTILSYQWPVRSSISSLKLPSLRCFTEGSQPPCSFQSSFKSAGGMVPKTCEGHYPKGWTF